MTRAAATIWVWAASILLVWAVVAVSLGQPLWQQQHSRDLTAYGAFLGETLTFGDSWKLLASQWLHVKFPHMLFNIAVIGLVGAGLTRHLSPAAVLALGLVGGAVGQMAAALLQPDAYISGASQAYLALCGAGLLILSRTGIAFAAAVIGVLVSVALDVFVSDHAGIKPGHLASFAFGLIAGGLYLFLQTQRPDRANLRRI
ncbi:rhomboid family intramembrane serine protease [Brevundimonas sp. R86498]|uniref:rhomboid family intramembrane serine protease n=1 Tax=Brevundimonas sp. R86498 TaxID=3093845 RepID=UPI0037CA2E60